MFNNKMSQITGCTYLSFQLPQTLLGGRLPSCRIFHPFIRPDKFHLFTSQQFSYKKVPRTRTTRLAWLTIVLAQSLGKANESRMRLIFLPRIKKMFITFYVSKTQIISKLFVRSVKKYLCNLEIISLQLISVIILNRRGYSVAPRLTTSNPGAVHGGKKPIVVAMICHQRKLASPAVPQACYVLRAKGVVAE